MDTVGSIGLLSDMPGPMGLGLTAGAFEEIIVQASRRLGKINMTWKGYLENGFIILIS